MTLSDSPARVLLQYLPIRELQKEAKTKAGRRKSTCRCNDLVDLAQDLAVNRNGMSDAQHKQSLAIMDGE